MKTAPLNKITLGDRQRKHFDREKIKELAESIMTKGLLHAIVCIEEFEDDQFGDVPILRLIAGERRLRAIE